MSLDSPTRIEKVITIWKAWPVVARVAVPLALVLVVIGAVLFGVSKVDHYFADRKTKQLRENVNIAVNAIKDAQANKQQDDIDIAVKTEKLKEATNAALDASNASDAARIATNATLANLANAVNANKPVGTTADDLQRRLDELNK